MVRPSRPQSTHKSKELINFDWIGHDADLDENFWARAAAEKAEVEAAGGLDDDGMTDRAQERALKLVD
jgi:hypothetical protein